jgi:hypothetical protein
MSKITDLFSQQLKPINVGLETFAQSLATQGVAVVAVDWQPPADGYVELDRLQGVGVDAANAEAVQRIMAGRPMLVGMGIAREVIPGFHDRLITHSGPPIAWERMSGPTRGAVIGALIYEGLADTPEAAVDLAASGAIEFAPLSPFQRGRAHGRHHQSLHAGVHRAQRGDGRPFVRLRAGPGLRHPERRAGPGAALRARMGLR